MKLVYGNLHAGADHFSWICDLQEFDSGRLCATQASRDVLDPLLAKDFTNRSRTDDIHALLRLVMG
jgi:hypothetical protein